MLHVYAAWAEGSVESDLETVMRGMNYGATALDAATAMPISDGAALTALPSCAIRQYKPRRAPEPWLGVSDLAANLAAEQPATN